MPSPAWEDLGVFLQTDDFAVVAIFSLQGGGTRQVNGIYDDPYMDAKLGEYQIDTSDPRFLCKELDVFGVRRGDTVSISGVVYDVMETPKSDGSGMATVKLATFADGFP